MAINKIAAAADPRYSTCFRPKRSIKRKHMQNPGITPAQATTRFLRAVACRSLYKHPASYSRVVESKHVALLTLGDHPPLIRAGLRLSP